MKKELMTADVIERVEGRRGSKSVHGACHGPRLAEGLRM